MGRRVSVHKKSAKRNIRFTKNNNKQKCSAKEISKKTEELNEELLEVLHKTLNHFFPHFAQRLEKVKDPRNPKKIDYKIGYLLWIGILLFLCKLAFRKQIDFNFNTTEFVNNINQLADTEQEKLAHSTTLVYLLVRLAPEELDKLIKWMLFKLIRMRCLEKFRLGNKYYMIAIDGTGHLVFGNKRHCEHCLTKKCKKTGKKIYYHNVLEAKLVCGNGLVFSIATEFVENESATVTKQDCELKAFYRLERKLKEYFPQLKICLLMDSLFAKMPVFKICKKNNWKFIIVFKKGSMREVYKEYELLKKLHPENFVENNSKEIKQEIRWVEDVLQYKQEKDCDVINVLECIEKEGRKTTRFVWLTNLSLNESNVIEIAKGGRLRWQIEEGFNMQKKHGYNLEHAYSENEIGIRNFYSLLQIAHMLSQLMEKGSLLVQKITKEYGSIKNFSQRLFESLRYFILPFERLQAVLSASIQIRLDSS